MLKRCPVCKGNKYTAPLGNVFHTCPHCKGSGIIESKPIPENFKKAKVEKVEKAVEVKAENKKSAKAISIEQAVTKKRHVQRTYSLDTINEGSDSGDSNEGSETERSGDAAGTTETAEDETQTS
jgi:uncharacterized Zn finger protein (UPF0148 family)